MVNISEKDVTFTGMKAILQQREAENLRMHEVLFMRSQS